MNTMISELISRARAAQMQFANATQEQADAAARAVCKVVVDNAETLARMAVDETQMGVYEDKIGKCTGKGTIIWNDLKTKKSVGIIGFDEEKQVYKVAKPIGVVASVCPCTNPVITPMSNSAFALKCRNAIIVAPHPRSKNTSKYVTDLFRAELKKLGLPEDLVQGVEDPTIELTGELMAAADVTVATGGMGMVRSAYSSGKPALGVGQGNEQCIVDTDSDLEHIADLLVQGRTFDNGMICSSEQSLICHKDQLDTILQNLEKRNVYVVRDEDEVERLREAVFPAGGAISRGVVGQDVWAVAKLAGITLPEGTKMMIVKGKGPGTADVLCKEKMCPVMVALTYETDFKEGVQIALKNLMVEGRGHSCVIHTKRQAHIQYAAEILPVVRLMVNQCAVASNGGAWHNGLTPTTTVGCGFWGNNSLSENLTYKHLMQITHVALLKENYTVPTYEEIFGE